MKFLLFFLTLNLAAQFDKFDAAARQQLEAQHIPALSLAFSDATKTIHQLHLGTATPQTQYRAGSITKLFTSIAIMQLVEAGKLDLDSPISRYLPELSFKSTLRQIASHRSGIVREPGQGHYFDTKPATLKQVTASLKKTKLVYEPGTTTKYSNAAISLLGDVIERTSGQTYQQYIQQHILTPLKLTHTTLKLNEANNLPKSLMWTVDGREFPAPAFDLGTSSAGNLVTTTEDLLTFARWLMRDNPSPILTKQSLDQMLTPQSGGTRFGIGFALNPPYIGHSGAVYGHSAILQVNPKLKTASVAFAAKDSIDLKPLIDPTKDPRPLTAFKQLATYPTLPPAFNSKSIGEYGWDFNKLYILEHEGKLHCLIEWFSLVTLEPKGNNQYRFPDNSMYAGETLTLKPNGLFVGPVWFPRLPEPNRNFRIQMQKSLAELKQIAAASQAPTQPTNLRKPELTNLRTLSNTIQFDIRYATSNNFMGAPLYSQKAAYLQQPAAQAVLAAHNELSKLGYGLLIHDAYRPWRVTKMFWEATPEAQRNFVANPATGSRHNRGCAVDLSLYDLKSGKPVEMVSGFDEFSDRAYPNYPGGTSRQRYFRELLRTAMEKQGFTVNDDEWWHFDFRDWKQYPVLDLSFEQLGSR